MTRRRSMVLPAPPSRKRPDDESPDLDGSLALAPPKMWTRGFLIVCGVVGVLGWMLLREMTTIADISLSFGVWLAPLGLVVVAIIVRRLLIPPSTRVIRFGSDGVELPGGRNSRRTFDVPYDKIRTIVPLVSRGQPALVIDGPKKTHVFVASDFPHPQAWRLLWGKLVERIKRRPDGADQIRQMQRLSDLSQETSSVKPRFTKYLLGFIAAVFAAQVFLSPDVDLLEFLYFGANSQVMVFEEGQWWRIVTANLLHGNGVHFAVNAFALYFLGTYCERLFGEGRTIVLTLATALAGATASLVGTEAMFAVGISTALFGLLGAYFALHLRFGAQLPPPYRQSRLWWGVILGLNGVLSFAVPIIDAWGHLGGFVAGIAIAWTMTRGQQKFEPRPTPGIATNLAAAGLVALFAASSVIAIGYAVGDHPEDEVAFARSLLEAADDEEPAMLAQVTHQWSQHTPRPEGVDPILVALAEKTHERGDDIFVQWRAAASLIRLAESMAEPFDRGVMESGLTRFERTAADHDDADARRALGGILSTFVANVGPFYATDAPFETATRSRDGASLVPEGRLDEPRRVYLLAFDEDTGLRDARWLLDRCLPAGDDTGANEVSFDREIPGNHDLHLAMVAAADSCSDERVDVWRTTEVSEPSAP